jgi:hypothetical protein
LFNKLQMALIEIELYFNPFNRYDASHTYNKADNNNQIFHYEFKLIKTNKEIH